jgi:hypothetical protein
MSIAQDDVLATAEDGWSISGIGNRRDSMLRVPWLDALRRRWWRNGYLMVGAMHDVLHCDR